MIWDVERKVKQGVVGFIVDRVLAIVIVLGVALLLLLSLTVGTWFAAFGNVLANVLPGIAYVYALRIVNYVIIFFIFTLLFAIIYKTLPNVSITWDDVWVGAAVTALLLTIGQALIGLYFSISRFGLAAGVAGAGVILLIWIYYSTQIVLIGAEFTQVYARKYRSKIKAETDTIPFVGIPHPQKGNKRKESKLDYSENRTLGVAGRGARVTVLPSCSRRRTKRRSKA
ncbi:MAG: YihY/virulence factor BrkB family protein [Ardenticatenaceae bacterium]|nr:YihY/virulence factor BrkB family protein [Ardenticatenaceae bacterium]